MSTLTASFPNMTIVERHLPKAQTYHITHSEHSLRRCDQRGISDQDVLMALDYGRCYFRQGLSFYVVLKKHLPKRMPADLKERLNNLVVVLKGECVVTSYKDHQAHRHIRKKDKTLR